MTREGVDLLAKALDAFIGVAAPVGALEAEGLGDDRDGEGAGLAGDLRDHGGGAGAGAAAHTGGYKDHVRALDELGQVLSTLLRGEATGLRVAANARPRVRRSPTWTRIGTSQRWSAWESVLTTM